jgi:hypothetical protein
MSALFASGRIIDLVLAIVGLEVLALLAWGRRGRGLAPLDLLGQLLAGALLLLAVRCALTGADYRWTAALVTASLPAHLFDLARRTRKKAPAALSLPR